MSDDDEPGNSESRDAISKLLTAFERESQNQGRPGDSSVTIQRTRVRKCSFCERVLSDNYPLVEGKSGVRICSDCIVQCSNILNEDDAE